MNPTDKPKAEYLGFNPHDSETFYKCTACGKTFGNWSIVAQKENENGTRRYCPRCKTELAGLEGMCCR